MAESTPWRTAISAPCPASSPQAMQTYRPQATRLSGRALVRAETAWILSIAHGTARHLRPRRGEEEKGQGQNARQRALSPLRRAGCVRLPSRAEPGARGPPCQSRRTGCPWRPASGTRPPELRRAQRRRRAPAASGLRFGRRRPQAIPGGRPPQNRRVRPASAPATCQPPESFFVCTDESLLSFILSLSFPFVTKILRLGEISCQFFAGFAPGRGGIFGRFLLTARGRRGYSSSWNPLISCKRPLQSGFSFYE